MVQTAVGFTHSKKGKWEAQKESKTLNFEENYGDAGTAREQSYLVNSDLNSKLEDTKCIGFNDSLKSMFVRHQRDEFQQWVGDGTPKKASIITYNYNK